MLYVDLNSDLGESFGRYTLGHDEDIIRTASSVNIACGMHAGDPLVMDKTVALCKQWNTAVGAHPGFPDLQGITVHHYSASIFPGSSVSVIMNYEF